MTPAMLVWVWRALAEASEVKREAARKFRYARGVRGTRAVGSFTAVPYLGLDMALPPLSASATTTYLGGGL